MGSIETSSDGHASQNGVVNGIIQKSDAPPPVTDLLASFVANANPSYLTPHIRARLKEYILDFTGVTLAAAHTAESTPAFLAAVKALGGQTLANSTESCTVLGVGRCFTPQYAGLLNAALGHSLDFDDTYAKGTLHAGVTAISAGLTQYEVLAAAQGTAPPPTIDTLLVSIAVGYELTCRLGALLGPEAYARGFHNTSTAGIFGAVATIAILKGLSAQTVTDAFGIAGSKAAGSMQYLANGSWNKRLHPGFAVHDAFVSVALAEAGVLGASQIFEGTMGFLNAYSPKPHKDLVWLVGELGQRWDFLETSLKPFPACRMTHGFIEHACRLGRDKGFTRASDVQRITLSLSPANVGVVGAPTRNKIHPENMVDAQFSAYFTTANSFLYGSDEGVRCYAQDRLADKEIHALSDKIVCVGDGTIREFGSKMKVEYAGDGKTQAVEVDIPYPLGEVQHPFTREQVERKFLSLVAPIYGEEKARRIRDAVDGIETQSIPELLALMY